MIREPAVAGQFYPANPASLRRVLESLLETHEPLLEARAVVAPHAGYVYSGAVAGAVYGSVKLPKRVIILGPNHTGRGIPLSLYPSGEWRTPLGLVAIDARMNDLLLEGCAGLHEDRAAHMREHSLEVQIPFLQALVPEFTFSAICVGTGDFASLDALGHAIALGIQSLGESVLIVASSDMTHYEPAEAAREKDRLAIDKVIAVDPRGLHDVVIERDISMCGFAPAVSALTACRDLGASSGKLIRYSNSGEVSGDYDRVVGYAGMAVS
ncbi:MAG TPA: AmmeMemoRadiSam system protein B [Acidobacteriota bacterium]|nr:AmmeMemoRadiSam system protein B [Acidobacteriota bacterium]